MLVYMSLYYTFFFKIVSSFLLIFHFFPSSCFVFPSLYFYAVEVWYTTYIAFDISDTIKVNNLALIMNYVVYGLLVLLKGVDVWGNYCSTDWLQCNRTYFCRIHRTQGLPSIIWWNVYHPVLRNVGLHITQLGKQHRHRCGPK